MEKSYVKSMDINFLKSIGFNKNQINQIYELVNRGIEERLYVNNHIPYHNIKHIERVLLYCIWILNKKSSNGENIRNQDILLYSALYHDCGRGLRVSNKMHGVASAKIAKEKLKNVLDIKTINMIELLIEMHSKKENIVDFKEYKFSTKEKENIQLLSDILKDADALDRNRIKLFKFAQCNPKYLRTNEAKEIYDSSNLLLSKYEEVMKY